VPTRSLALLLALLALGATACTHPIVVKAPTLYPARIPVRAFPSIWLSGTALPEGDLIERLRVHLAENPQREVKRVELKELEPQREAGAISPLTLVVIVQPTLFSDAKGQWDVVPVTYCDFYWGCYTDYQSYYSVTPELVAEVGLTVYEGPTARVLQNDRLQSISYERDSEEARRRLLDELGLKLERAVDVLQSEIQLELEPVDEIPAARQAVEHMRRGAFAEGRSLLEQAAQQLGGLKKRLQARVWYDLGVARWLAPGPHGLTQPAFEAAERALKLADELDGSERYETTLERLRLARQRQAVLEEQRRAMEHNFALRGTAPANVTPIVPAPAPPPSGRMRSMAPPAPAPAESAPAAPPPPPDASVPSPPPPPVSSAPDAAAPPAPPANDAGAPR